jgi:CxxC motif-containing protein (DUF1111 family)
MVRARTIDEAIRWHGGEAQASKVAYEGLERYSTQCSVRFPRKSYRRVLDYA